MIARNEALIVELRKIEGPYYVFEIPEASLNEDELALCSELDACNMTGTESENSNYYAREIYKQIWGPDWVAYASNEEILTTDERRLRKFIRATQAP